MRLPLKDPFSLLWEFLLMNSEGLTTPSSLGPSPPWAEARRESWAALGDDGLEDGGDWAGEEALECEGLSLLPKDPVVLCEDEGEALGEGVEGMGGGGGGGGSEWVRVTGARSLEGAGGWGAAGGMDSVDCSCRRPDDARAAVAAVPLPPSSNSAGGTKAVRGLGRGGGGGSMVMKVAVV